MKRSGLWVTYRIVMLVAGASLAFYIPYKYATQLHAFSGLYAFLFPLSSVLAVAGIAIGVKPDLAFRAPARIRAAVAILATGWVATGILCVPSLAAMTLETPFAGLFAFFHMAVQHVVLSLGVAVIAIAPRATRAFFGVDIAAAGERATTGWEPAAPETPVGG